MKLILPTEIFVMPIAEFMLAYILSYVKLFPTLYTLEADRQWLRSADEPKLPIGEIESALLLIIGAGVSDRRLPSEPAHLECEFGAAAVIPTRCRILRRL